MRIKVKDKSSGRFVVFDLNRPALEKHGRLLAISDGDGGWYIDNGLSDDGFQWEPIGEDAALGRVPISATLSFKAGSTVCQQLSITADDDEC